MRPGSMIPAVFLQGAEKDGRLACISCGRIEISLRVGGLDA
jgi:hypothetical protein